MLLNSFYSILSSSVSQSEQSVEIEASLNIHPDHSIFKGHFLGNPIVPGVAWIQIIKETSETLLGKQMFLKSSGSIKFLALTHPDDDQKLMLSCKFQFSDSNTPAFKAIISRQDVTIFKFDGFFQLL